MKFDDLDIRCPLCHTHNVMVSIKQEAVVDVLDTQMECCEDDCGCVFSINFHLFENDVVNY